METLCRPPDLPAPAPRGGHRGSRAGCGGTLRMLVLGDEQHLIAIDVSAGKRNQRGRQ
ncbi:MAG TPA: hypothetical protein VJ283_10630 [Trebonia sp.]|nr:hypothetical protein [Trebonia sp.]